MRQKLGIDLGTYNSSAAVAVQRDTVMVMSKEGRSPDGKNFPSFVQFDNNGSKVSVGVRAKRARMQNPELVIWGVKRLVGQSYQKAKDSGEISRFKYVVERGPSDDILIRVGNERFTPSHILEAILREIKEDAENETLNPLFGGSFDEAVISIPAYFPAIRTAPIIEAARQAGFKDVATIAEPTAAAVQYGLQIDRESIILAFDLGAGTLDVSVLQLVQDGDSLVSGELCTSGHEALGGLDMDDLIEKHLVDRYKLLDSILPRDLAVLRDEIERTKIQLSKAQKARVAFPLSEISLTRVELEEVVSPILRRFRGPIQMAIKDAGLEASSIDHVLLVGGPTQMPCVRRALRDELAALGAKQEVLAEIDAIEQRGFPVNPMECVCRGAALKAAGVIKPATMSMPEGYGVVFSSPIGLHYGEIIKRNSNYPIDGKRSLLYSDPNSKTITAKLVAKRVDSDRYSESIPVFRYEHLGDLNLSVVPTGDLLGVEFSLSVSKNKELTATLTQERTGVQVKYKSPELLKNDLVELMDYGDIPASDKSDLDAQRAKYNREKGTWTKKESEDCVLMAMRVLGLAKDYDHQELREAVKALQSSVNGASYTNPEATAMLANRIREFLDLLRQPEIGIIKADEFRKYLDELAGITS